MLTRSVTETSPQRTVPNELREMGENLLAAELRKADYVRSTDIYMKISEATGMKFDYVSQHVSSFFSRLATRERKYMRSSETGRSASWFRLPRTRAPEGHTDWGFRNIRNKKPAPERCFEPVPAVTPKASPVQKEPVQALSGAVCSVNYTIEFSDGTRQVLSELQVRELKAMFLSGSVK